MCNEWKKIAILPNGEVFMCVDQYYSKEKPLTEFSDPDDLIDRFKNYTLQNNRKPYPCDNCEFKKLCRLCPLQLEIEKTCQQHKKYYTIILFYLKIIYSNPKLIKYFISYSGVTDGMVFLFYKYLNSIK